MIIELISTNCFTKLSKNEIAKKLQTKESEAIALTFLAA